MVRHGAEAPLSSVRPPTIIGLDARNRFAGTGGTGVATYADTLAARIRALGWQPRWLMAEASPARATGPLRRIGRALDLAARPARAQSGTGDWLLPDVFRVARVHEDLYRRAMPVELDPLPAMMHWTYPLPLRVCGVPELLTVHDLIPIEHPELSGVSGARLDRLLRRRLPTVARVVTVSATVRAALIARYGTSPDRVVNTYQAVDLTPDLLRLARNAAAPAPPGCFVVVGTVESRKNVARIIRAHGLADTRRPLVIAGPDGDDAAEQMAAVSAHPEPGRVIRLSWLSRPELVRLMMEARALLFPSLAEGFGLPIVEAMTLGVPVLTSRGGATEEIAGGAALLIDPHDEAGMACAIAVLDRDDALRASLIERGSQRARLFTPEAYATRIAALYRDVLANPSGGAQPFGGSPDRLG